MICIVGRGYVGLALAIQLFRSGTEGTGLDIDHRKVNQAHRGHSYFKHLVGKTISKAKNKAADRVDGVCQIPKANGVIICVPTALDNDREQTSFGQMMAVNLLRTAGSIQRNAVRQRDSGQLSKV